MQQFLYLVRHAHASDAPTDPERPLSSKGERQCARIGAALAGKGLIAPTLVWQSPYLRARATAELLLDRLELGPRVETVEGITPFDPPERSAYRIDRTRENLMVVGHEPHLSGLASILVSNSSSFGGIDFPKASILCLNRLAAGKQTTAWQIHWHISHKFFK